MKCYFCRNDIRMADEDNPGPYRVRISETCRYCTVPNNLYDVTTVIDENGDFEYAHIYPDEQKWTTEGISPNIPNSIMSVPANVAYHILLNIKENTTHIRMITTIEELLKLPGMSIKPTNAREKLKLYLLFS
jgi:hypothetical protein